MSDRTDASRQRGDNSGGLCGGKTFLKVLVDAVPYMTHLIMGNNGIQFGNPPQYHSDPTTNWTNGLVERRN
jgi:hypothetical protein